MAATEAGSMHPPGMHVCYHLQTKFAKVMFLHLSVSHSVHGGHAWLWGACMIAGGVGVHDWGVHGCGSVCMVAWGGACMVGGGVWL